MATELINPDYGVRLAVTAFSLMIGMLASLFISVVLQLHAGVPARLVLVMGLGELYVGALRHVYQQVRYYFIELPLSWVRRRQPRVKDAARKAFLIQELYRMRFYGKRVKRKTSSDPFKRMTCIRCGCRYRWIDEDGMVTDACMACRGQATRMGHSNLPELKYLSVHYPKLCADLQRKGTP